MICLYWLLLIVIIANILPLESINVHQCGINKGCLRIPSDCSDVDCEYLLQWSNKSKQEIYFELMGRVKHQNYWLGFALNEKSKMSGGGVVDCINTPKKFLVHSSYNKGHKNKVLDDKYLGLDTDSLVGKYEDGIIYCNFTRIISVDPSHKEAYKVKDLQNPYYVMFAIGKADTDGYKHSHKVNPFVSDSKISFLSYKDYGGSDERSFYIRLHGSLMVIGWMMIASIGIMSSRYFKSEPVVICSKPAWFQIHLFSILLTIISTVTGFLLMLYHENWTFYLVDIHPILGIIVISLMFLNGFLGICRPNPDMRYRWIFNYVHAIIGHLAYLLSLVAMYFGLSAMASEMPTWTPWLVVVFATWKLLVDIVLTFIKRYDSSKPYQLLNQVKSSKNTDKLSGWRRAIVICYLLVTFGIVISLLLAINIKINEDNL